MNVLNISTDLEDIRPKISVGIAVRKTICYLNEELLRVIKELAPMNNIENKKITLQTLVREFHNVIKKLQVLIKNAYKYDKLSHLDKLSAMLFNFNGKIVEGVDQLYYTHEMCKFYRNPKFNMEQLARVIFETSHRTLKKKICSGVHHLILQEKPEEGLCFMEKFYYGEKIENTPDKNKLIEKMKKESLFILHLNNHLIKLQNLESKEFVQYF